MPIAIWVLGTAAAFLFGCFNKQGSNKKKSEQDKQPSATPPPLPPKEKSAYIAEFGTNLQSSAAYRNLIKKGVKPAQVDIGCRFPNTPLMGKGDFRVEACEVDEFIFENRQKFPKIFEERTQSPSPWNPGPNVRGKLQKVINALKQMEGIKDLPLQGDTYRKKLATALFYYTLLPDRPSSLIKQYPDWKNITALLKYLKLEKFQKQLLTTGGLGVSLWKEDTRAKTNGTATEALNNRVGSEIAKANLLFAIFEQAQLKPYFAKIDLTPPKVSVEDKTQKGKKIRVYRTSAFLVGISFEKEDWVFDLTEGQIKTKPGHCQKLPEKIFYANYLSWRGANQVRNNQQEAAIKLFQKSLEFNPKSYAVHNSLGLLFLQKGEIPIAELALKEAIRINPQYSLALENLGDLHWGKGNKEEALKNYYEALKKDKTRMITFSKSKLSSRIANVLKQDPDNTLARTIRQQIK